MSKGLLILGIKSIGCPSCIAPAKARILRVKGVKGVHVLPGKIIVIYDPNTTDPDKIFDESRLRDYYTIVKWENKIIDEDKLSNYIPRLRYGLRGI